MVGMLDLMYQDDLSGVDTNPTRPRTDTPQFVDTNELSKWWQRLRGDPYAAAPVQNYATPDTPWRPRDWNSGARPVMSPDILPGTGVRPDMLPAPPPSLPPAQEAPPAPASPSFPPGILNGAPLPASMSAGGYPVLPAPAPARAAPSMPLWATSAAVPNPGGPAAPAAPSSADIPETSLLGRLGKGASDFLSKANDWRNDHRLTLMALGAGMAGAQTLGQGLNRGMTMAVPAMQQDIAQQHQNQTVNAMVNRGIPKDVALAAAGNPAIMQQIVANVFGAKQKQFTQIGEDMLGNKQYGFVDPVSAKVYGLDGKEMGTGGASSGGGLSSDFLAKGVTSVDQGLKGTDYLAQFSPEVQASVKAYVNGESMPTGNPRKGFTQAVKMIAQKYGQDTGTPADDNTYAAKHKMLTGLASTAPGGIGGQVTYARTSLNHLADVSEAANDLNNSSGLGIAPLAHLFNNARGLTTEQAAKVKALGDKAGHYGQEITKYYAGSPGGEAERTAFLKSLSGANAPEELAAVLESELELARGKITKTQATIDETMGRGSRHQVMTPAEERDVGRVEAAIARLRGLPAAAHGASAPAAPASVVPSGHYQWTPDRGLVPVK